MGGRGKMKLRKSPVRVKKKFRLRRPKGKEKIFLSTPPPPWIELPRDVTANILHRLGAVEILESAQKVCTTWWSVCKDPSMWRVIDMRNLGGTYYTPYDLEIMCLHAVDRSQGQLIEINIESFGTDKLLLNVAQRSSELRCLSVSCCYGVSGDGMQEAARILPQLEELHLILAPNISDFDIETVGHSCPSLKSFTFNQEFYNGREGTHYEQAVAKTMPNLRHLRLVGNQMTNEGVEAILDGCLHLESLDLRRCLNVDLGGHLGKRCSEQIKHLRGPHDSIADCPWSAEYDDFEWSSEDYDNLSFGCASSFGDFDYDYEDYQDYYGGL